MQKSHTVRIIGHGMTGLFAAIAFKKAGYSVYSEVPEKEEAEKAEKKEIPSLLASGNDPRVSAITPVSVSFLKKMGVWEMLAEKTPFYQIKVWDISPDDAFYFKSDTLWGDSLKKTETPLGYIVENQVLYLALKHGWEKLQAEDAEDKKTEKFFYKKKENNEVLPDLTLIADGAQSPTRKKLGMGYQVKRYQQAALVAVVKMDFPHQNTACQRFLDEGPLAFLPLADPSRCAIVWSVPENRAPVLLSMPEDLFIKTLQAARGIPCASHAKWTLVSERRAFDLVMQHADSYVRQGHVLIGDAAHTVHPLAGYGLNMGFLDVITLLKVMRSAQALSLSLGSLALLQRYERVRRVENAWILKVIDALTVPALRKAGFYGARRSKYLQHFFTHFMSSYGLDNKNDLL